MSACPLARVRACRAGHFSDQRLLSRASVISLFLGLTFASCNAARADQLLAHGTGEMFWIARVVEPDAGSTEELRTVVRGRAVGAEAQWVDVAQLASRVTSLAHRGNQLAALLDSGTWMLLWAGGSSVGAQPHDGARLLMLASDDASIWAIGAGGSPVMATTTRASADAPADAPVEPQQPPHPEGLALYRLDHGQWARVAPLPGEVTTGDAARTAFAVTGAGPTIAVLRFGGTVQTYTYGAEDVRWDALAPLGAKDAARLKLLGGGGERSVLWLAPEAGAGRIHVAGQRGWGEPRELKTSEQIAPAAPRTLAWAGGAVRLLFIRDGTTFEQAFDVTDGAARTDARPLRTTASTATDSLPGRVVTVAAAAMLLMVVLSSMRRAAGAGGPDGAAPAAAPNVVPAPLLPRVCAGLIDLLPLAVACWFVFRDVDPNTQTIDDMISRTSLPFYLALAGYLAYTFLAEALFARTVGKALLGLRVASLDGSPPGAVAAFARNALRLIDVTMLGLPLLLVLLSPLRQRAGDIAARTVVVSDKPDAKARDVTTDDERGTDAST